MTLFQSNELNGTWLGRAWVPDVGPVITTIRNESIVDITTATAPTTRDILEMDDPASYIRGVAGTNLGLIEELATATRVAASDKRIGASALLQAPCDLQSIKACGVTFAKSMVERVIEEQAAGDPSRADSIRKKVTAIIGTSLDQLEAGSPEAESVKQELIKAGMWSQYLEVGIGPDAEVFSKAQVLSSVGWGNDIGLHPISTWNNPEPEIVLAVNSKGSIQGVTLGNDVNLRDIEGRSALLLSKAKDNNGSCAIGPMIRVFDETYSMTDVRTAELKLVVEGLDGYRLEGSSEMKEISRSPENLVEHTIGRHHQYPDGFMLFLGTLFAPTEDRDEPGQGFTHKLGDIVTISCPGLGALQNTVQLSTECPEWTFGASHLMRNLAKRNLL